MAFRVSPYLLFYGFSISSLDAHFLVGKVVGMQKPYQEHLP